MYSSSDVYRQLEKLKNNSDVKIKIKELDGYKNQNIYYSYEHLLEINIFQDYVYFDSTPVASGVRVGVEKLNPETNEVFLDLDKGIRFGN